jgi:hypothetical protein
VVLARVPFGRAFTSAICNLTSEISFGSYQGTPSQAAEKLTNAGSTVHHRERAALQGRGSRLQ